MEPDTSAVTIQPCKNCGTQAPVDVHFCPRCDRILTLGRHGDYFTFFGLPRRLRVDEADLDQRFRALSRQFHPDYFYNASSTERLASLERSSYLNDGFRTLREPVDRIEYLLKLEGFEPKGAHEATAQVPPELLEEVFELNEQLEAIQQMRADGASEAEVAAALEAARRPIQASLDDHERQLNLLMAQHDAEWERGDAAGRRQTLEALRAQLMQRTYLTNLLATVRRELGGDQAARL
ncbi:MAG: Fe-S protein assembly co-chaperone HscB [Acidobacteria bacterium]|nr:Fe-S protein assembly co-chaperone HscB [Acidobacteriota bacterium]